MKNLTSVRQLISSLKKENNVNHCINLTLKMHTCMNKPKYIVVRKNGTMSLHCARHFSFFYGRWGADFPGETYIRYYAGRYDQLKNSVDPADDAWRYGLLDSWGIGGR